MKYHLVLTGKAISDIEKQKNWYEKKQKGLGTRFLMLYLIQLKQFVLIQQDIRVNTNTQENYWCKNFPLL